MTLCASGWVGIASVDTSVTRPESWRREMDKGSQPAVQLCLEREKPHWCLLLRV